MASTHFKSSTRLCKWTKKNISKFQELEASCVKSSFYEVRSEDTEINGRLVLRRFNAIAVEELPEELSELAYRIVVDLRNALDQACNAASRLVRKDDSLTKANFPFGDTQQYVERQLASTKGPWRDIPTELHSVLLGFEPFATTHDGREGNKWLYFLNKIANLNKHEQIIEAFFSPMGCEFRNLWGWDFYTNVERISEGHFHLFVAWPTSPNRHIDFDVVPELRLVGSGPLSDVATSQALSRLSDIVGDIVVKLERTARDLAN